MEIATLHSLGHRRGAAVLLEVLRSEGVRYIFGNPGTTELALMDAPNISYVLALQEASVVATADGYPQAAQRPGFINLHAAGGLGHGFGNLLNASVSGAPLVVTAGQQDSRHSITDPLLFGNLVRIARPAVKWAQEIAHPDQIPVLIRIDIRRGKDTGYLVVRQRRRAIRAVSAPAAGASGHERLSGDDIDS